MPRPRKKVIQDLFVRTDFDLMVKYCLDDLKISRGDLFRSRFGIHMRARQCIQFILKTETKLSYPEIGKLFYNDHTTIMENVKKFRKYLVTNNLNSRDMYDAMKSKISTKQKHRIARFAEDNHQLYLAIEESDSMREIDKKLSRIGFRLALKKI